MSKQQQLKQCPLYNETCRVWYFESNIIVFGSHRYEIISTDGTTRDPTHTIRTPDKRLVEMKTSELVAIHKKYIK